jgi:hypothetical protein
MFAQPRGGISEGIPISESSVASSGEKVSPEYAVIGVIEVGGGPCAAQLGRNRVEACGYGGITSGIDPMIS